jgi:hypothetical protein
MKTTIGMITVALSALAGCASTPKEPSAAVSRAEVSVDQADQAGARRYDPGTLDTSKEKLGQAKAAALKGNAMASDQLAEQAQLDAELAAATARAANAKKAADEVKASTATLRGEIARQSAP